MKTKILLADDHAIVREGLRAIIETQPDMEVVGEADTGFEALRLAKELAPHVVVMDVMMPKLNGLEAARIIHREVPSTRVIILSTYGYEEYVQEILQIGVAGYLLKQDAGTELLKALREVKQGNAYFSPAVSKDVLKRSREAFVGGDQWEKRHKLTDREWELLRLLAGGNSNKMMAAQLAISIKTVEKHRQSIMNKLKIHETAGLTRYALEKGVIEASLNQDPCGSSEGETEL